MGETLSQPEELWTVEQIAELTGLEVDQILAWIETGQVAYVEQEDGSYAIPYRPFIQTIPSLYDLPTALGEIEAAVEQSGLTAD